MHIIRKINLTFEHGRHTTNLHLKSISPSLNFFKPRLGYYLQALEAKIHENYIGS